MPNILTKAMVEVLKKKVTDDKVKTEIDLMEGKEIKEGGPIQLTPGKDETAWYIVY